MPDAVNRVILATDDDFNVGVTNQGEFNPREVAAYRLIGYENRLLRHEDFNDDRKDAGEIGAGHSVTALYEIVPVGMTVPGPAVDALRHQTETEPTRAAASGELLSLKVRYKAPDGDASRLLTTTMRNPVSPAMPPNLGFASAVAEFGMLLRASPDAGDASFLAAASRARRFMGNDEEGYRAEFVRLVDVAARLARDRPAQEHRGERLRK